jgi:hypothetical protein
MTLMPLTFNGKSLISEHIERARESARLLTEFEKKHFTFLSVCPPDIGSSGLRVPWLSWPDTCARQIAEYFGNDGWKAVGDSREKVVDGIAVAVHGLGPSQFIPLVPFLDVTGGAGCKIGIQTHSLN